MSPEKRTGRQRARDVLAATRRIADKTMDIDIDTFRSDQDRIDIVCYQMLIIGEAVDALPPELKQAHPELDWAGMKAMRNVMAHVYWGIDLDTVWRTSQKEVPELRAAIETFLSTSDD